MALQLPYKSYTNFLIVKSTSLIVDNTSKSQSIYKTSAHKYDVLTEKRNKEKASQSGEFGAPQKTKTRRAGVWGAEPPRTLKNLKLNK